MICAACEGNIHPASSPELEQLATAVQGRLGGQVRDLRLLLRDNGLVLRAVLGLITPCNLPSMRS
jgi:hypothetical protein